MEGGKKEQSLSEDVRPGGGVLHAYVRRGKRRLSWPKATSEHVAPFLPSNLPPSLILSLPLPLSLSFSLSASFSSTTHPKPNPKLKLPAPFTHPIKHRRPLDRTSPPFHRTHLFRTFPNPCPKISSQFLQLRPLSSDISDNARTRKAIKIDDWHQPTFPPATLNKKIQKQ